MKNYLLLFLILSMSSSLSFIVSGEPTPVNIGVILDMKSRVGKSSFVSMKIAMDDFYTAHPNYTTRIVFKTRDSQKKVISAATAALDLIQNERVEAIIGPQTSSEAPFVGDLGAKANVPIVSFSATCPALSPTQSPFFIRTGLSDAAQAPAIAALIQAYGWRRLVPIYEDTDYGAGFIPSLVEALLGVGVNVPYRSIVSKDSADDDLLLELYRLKSMQTRVFLLHMSTSLAVKLFDQAEAACMMDEGFVWIISGKLTSLLPSVAHDSIQGVLGLRPYVPVTTDKYHKFHKRWRREFRREFVSDDDDDDSTKLTTFSLWAYDTVWAVALAVEAAASRDFTRVVSEGRRTDLSAIPVSKTGKKLLHEIKRTRFNGLAGEFHLVGGELNVSVFQLMNLHGKNEMKIGYWTPIAGLHRHLGKDNNGGYSASMESLRPVIWPGEPKMVPKGWEMPTSGKKLKIAVPGTVLPGFRSFLNVRTDSKTNQTIFGGFVIEVFESAVKRLPYALPFEYVSYKSSDGKSTGSYDDLVHQVTLQKFDAVVGDTTITAKRLGYVDFTLPYTLAGISMVVPLQNKQSKNAWIFVKPLTLDLWLVSLSFFVFTGFIVWVLEHRINPEFRGPPMNQLGTIFYFTFSTLVFAHRENIVSNLGRFVVIIWVFVVLILQSSYTASLTSMLTVDQFVPSYSHINELKERGLRVGHLNNSFVKDFLTKTQGFNQEKLVPFRSPEEYAEALAKGSQNDGVAAVIDEIPYLKVFLKYHCDNYTMAGQIYKTGGFGFAFPKGSSLAQDLSRAILNITEGDEMTDIERRWFGDQTNCLKQGSKLSSNSLNFRSFWGLFLITGIASLVAFCIYWIIFFHKNRNQLMSEIGPGHSLPWRLQSIGWLFDQKDLSSHTFRNAEVKDGSTRGTNNCPQSPLSYSTADTFGGGTPTTDELATPNSETPLHGEVTIVHEAR
ncbi:hypothetical protein J5N97_003400 [Dioscorea zingiberensis]|uniref:Glutamate receptor n=1 Tax=Dioscorea zingiberensis TaxID=325984 RepID=A0A9D5D5S5_9LILI|nr:hypothetical protein J5N97_003400 [Dioscorea zingiberensis]